MSIQGEIDRINNNVQTTLQTIANTGVSVGTNSDALPAAAAVLANEKAPVDHTHTLNNLSGVLSPEKGGTGVASLTELATAMGCTRTATGTYTGTGTRGSSNPSSLTFDFKPKYFWILCNADSTTYVMECHAYGLTSSYIVGGYNPESVTSTRAASGVTASYAKLSGNTLSWYNTSSTDFQMNTSGNTYTWLAIG